MAAKTHTFPKDIQARAECLFQNGLLDRKEPVAILTSTSGFVETIASWRLAGLGALANPHFQQFAGSYAGSSFTS